MITREMVLERLVYRRESGDFLWKKFPGTAIPGSVAGQISGWGYVRIPIYGKKQSAHRLVWLMEHGALPTQQLDHIDGDKRNNRIENLRLVTPSLNQLCNQRPRKGNSTGLVGVSNDRGGRFKAQIKLNGKSCYLGSFQTAADAHQAYLEAKHRHLVAHGIGTEKGDGDGQT